MKIWQPQKYLDFLLKSQGDFFKAPPLPHLTVSLSLPFVLSDLKSNQNISARCREILRLLLRPEPLKSQEISCMSELETRRLENKQKNPNP